MAKILVVLAVAGVVEYPLLLRLFLCGLAVLAAVIHAYVLLLCRWT